jgi:hypothetical protein
MFYFEDLDIWLDDGRGIRSEVGTWIQLALDKTCFCEHSN